MEILFSRNPLQKIKYSNLGTVDRINNFKGGKTPPLQYGIIYLRDFQEINSPILWSGLPACSR